MRARTLLPLTLLAFLAGGASWFALQGRGAVAAPQDADPSWSPRPAAPRPRERAATTTPADTAPAPREPESPSKAAVAPAPPPVPGRTRLPVTIVRTFRCAPRTEIPDTPPSGPPTGTGLVFHPGRSW